MRLAEESFFLHFAASAPSAGGSSQKHEKKTSSVQGIAGKIHIKIVGLTQSLGGSRIVAGVRKKRAI